MDNFEFDSSLIEPIISFLDTGINKFLPAVLILASLIAVIDGIFSIMLQKMPVVLCPKLL